MKVVIIGTSSSHTLEYGKRLVARGCLHGIWSEDEKSLLEICDVLKVSQRFKTLSDAIQSSDLVMVLGRYGDEHLVPATIAGEFGKKCYVDKPFTNCGEDARLLAGRSPKDALVSFSPYRFSQELKTFDDLPGSFTSMHLCVPMNTLLIEDKRAKKIHFYGIHGIDLALKFLGSDTLVQHVEKTASGAWVQLVNERNQKACIDFFKDREEFYSITMAGPAWSRHAVIDPYGDMYDRTLDFLLGDYVLGKNLSAPLKEAVRSIEILDEIERKIS